MRTPPQSPGSASPDSSKSTRPAHPLGSPKPETATPPLVPALTGSATAWTVPGRVRRPRANPRKTRLGSTHPRPFTSTVRGEPQFSSPPAPSSGGVSPTPTTHGMPPCGRQAGLNCVGFPAARSGPQAAGLRIRRSGAPPEIPTNSSASAIFGWPPSTEHYPYRFAGHVQADQPDGLPCPTRHSRHSPVCTLKPLQGRGQDSLAEPER